MRFLDVSGKVFVIATHGSEDLARVSQKLGWDNSDTQWKAELCSADVKEKQKSWSSLSKKIKRGTFYSGCTTRQSWSPHSERVNRHVVP
ncbi:hypothetical protein AOLI_G00284840 [Acnodon oligacanthus]